MSSIDDRIVQMEFNNRQFESGVKETLTSLDKLKNGLKLDDAARNLTNLERAGNRFSLSGIAAGVEGLQQRFSALQVIGITALQSITNAALSAGTKVMNALTIDPIKTGYEEYETKMNAIQTILTNTASKGTTLKEVNKTLNDLNEYSDKTIYNFAEMAKNIGTFTAAGVGLKSSAEAIKGIANLGAGSGSNPQQVATAMYQLSQALAAGKVNLQDWNSVVNAGMGGELFQNALKKTAGEMGVVIDKTKSFRESISSRDGEGWLSAKILLATLKKFANDPVLVKAATEVKTLTQLFGTMKESVQSGWAQSWEKIVGNKEEASKLFTALNDGFTKVVGGAADARNATLSFWKEQGGRTDLLNGMSAALKTLSSVLTPIGEAFREFFPAVTGERLVEISQKFVDAMTGFKIGQDTIENIQRTFRGLFAALDIGRMAIVGIAKAFLGVLVWLKPVGDSLLGLSASIGDFVVKLRDALKTSNPLEAFADKVSSVFGPAVDGIRDMIAAIIKGVASLGTIDTAGLETFSEKFKAAFGPVFQIAGIFSKAVAKVAPILATAAKAIGAVLQKLVDKITQEFQQMDFTTIINILNSALIMGILNSVNNFVKKLTEISSSGTSIVGNIKTILDGVGSSLEAYQQNLKAKTLITIASAIAILAASLIAISMIDPGKLQMSLEALSVLFAEMFAASGIFGKIMGGVQLVGAIKSILVIQGLAIAIMILAKALNEIADLDWEQLAKGALTLAALAAILSVSVKVMNGSLKGLSGAAIGMVAFAAAIRLLVGAVEDLAILPLDKLAKGLIGVGVIMTELAVFMKLADFKNIGVMNSIALIGLAIAINILADAVTKFGLLDVPQILKGLGAMAIVLAELTIFTKLMSGAKSVIPVAIGLTILATSMLIFGQAITNIGSLPLENIAKGLGGLAGVLLIVAGVMRLMPGNMILTAVGMNVLGVALITLSIALKNLGSMSLEQIGKGLLALGGSLVILAGGMYLMAGGIPGAIAMTIMAGALALLVPSLMILSSIPLKGVIVGLFALAATFGILAGATALLTPLIPAMLGLSASIALFGVGILAIGAGVTFFATGIALLANNLGLFVLALAKAVKDIVTIIPDLFKLVSEAIKALANVIGEAAPALIKSFLILLGALLEAADIALPKITALFIKLILDILKKFDEAMPEIIKRGVSIIVSLLAGIAKKVPELVTVGADIIVNIINGLSNNLARIVEAASYLIITFVGSVGRNLGKIAEAGFLMIVEFINALAESVRTNLPLLVKAVGNLMSAFVDAGMSILNDSIKTFSGIGKNIVLGLIEGIKTMIKSAVSIVGELGSSIIDAAKDVLGIHSPSAVFRDQVGKMIAEGTAKGIAIGSKKAVSASVKMSNDMLAGGKKAFEKATEWIDSRKYYNKLSLAQELVAWEKLQQRYKKGSDERIKIDREIYRVKQEIAAKQKELDKKILDDAMALIDEKKYYNKLSLEDELAGLLLLQKKYKANSEERKQIDREVYRVKNEIEQKAFDDSIKLMEDKKYYDKLTLEDELAGWVALQNKYAEGTEERKQADKEVYRLKKELIAKTKDLEQEAFDRSVELIDEKKYYNKLSLAQERVVWEELQKKYKEGSEQRKKIDREVYRVHQEMSAKSKEIDDKYFTSVTETNKALAEDIKSLTDEYDNAVKSRAKSLYDSYKLFDKVDVKEVVDGQQLLKNIKDQVAEFEVWQNTLGELTAKGVSANLIQELQDMGPDSIAEIQALNKLTSSELSEYVSLWQQKQAEANQQATSELSGLKATTASKIADLTKVASEKLTEYAAVWKSELDTLNDTVTEDMTKITTEIVGTFDVMSVDVEKVFTELAVAMKSAMLTPEWGKVGAEVVDSLATGLMAQASILADTITTVVKNSLVRAMEVLKSDPSITGLISDVTSLIMGVVDVNPVVTPVVDLTNITAANKTISAMGNDFKMEVGATMTSKIPVVPNPTSTAKEGNSSSQNSTTVSLTQNNYSPKPLSRIEIFRQTKNMLNLTKGMVTG